MPLIAQSTYTPPPFLANAHLQTVLPSLVRRCDASTYSRERIGTPDGDFLDIDWARTGGRKVAIVSHGLEGDSHRHYVVGMVNALNRAGWDAAAWNYRSCSGEANRRLRLYHNGVTDDLDCVVQHVLATGRYDELALVGFSLGGNLSLLYLGSDAFVKDARITRAVTFSVPCDLAAGAAQIARPENRLYMNRFLRMLREKIRMKMAAMPGTIDDEGYDTITDFRGFDDRYTAPIHGFKDAEDYWHRCSCGRFLSGIRIPALIVNALDDPFLAGGCYPREQAAGSSFVHLETPAHGGHVGFIQFNRDGNYWSDRRAVEFLSADNV